MAENINFIRLSDMAVININNIFLVPDAICSRDEIALIVKYKLLIYA